MKARDVMTPNPITVVPETTLAPVWDLMREADIRHVPVVQAGVLVGMVSDRDLASLDVARVQTADGADALRRALATPVVTVMSSDVIFVECRAPHRRRSRAPLVPDDPRLSRRAERQAEPTRRSRAR